MDEWYAEVCREMHREQMEDAFHEQYLEHMREVPESIERLIRKVTAIKDQCTKETCDGCLRHKSADGKTSTCQELLDQLAQMRCTWDEETESFILLSGGENDPNYEARMA